MADLRELLRECFKKGASGQEGVLGDFCREVNGQSEFVSGLFYLRRDVSNWVIITKEGIYFSMEEKQKVL